MLYRDQVCSSTIRYPESGTVVTLGNFDGIHQGHRRLLEHADQTAKHLGLPLIVITFWPHTSMIIPGKKKELIYSEEQKYRLMERIVPDADIIVFTFDETLRNMPEADFFEKILMERFHAQAIVVGDDCRYGFQGRGTTETLMAHCREKEIGFQVQSNIMENGSRVSSTRIREVIESGHMEEAEKLLGDPYFLEDTVFVGKRLGRTIDIPTVNIYLPEGAVSPRRGVYVTRVTTPLGVYGAMTNVGVNPTVEHGDRIKVESHLLDFSGDLYGQFITVEFLCWVRDEQRFESLEALKSQLSKDKETTRRIYQNIR